MDLAAFFTARFQAIPPNAPDKASGGLNRALSGVDAAAENGAVGDVGFFKQILTQISGELEPNANSNKGQEHSALKSDNALLSGNPRLDLASFIGSTQGVQDRIDANRERIDLGAGVELQQALALNDQAVDEILMPTEGDTVIDGLAIADEVNGDAPPSVAADAIEDDLIVTEAPEAPQEISLASLLNSLPVGGNASDKGIENRTNSILKRIERFTQRDELPSLSAIGFTPAQITRLQKLQEEGEDLAAMYDALEAAGVMQDALDSIFQPPAEIVPPTAIEAGDEIIIPPQDVPEIAASDEQEDMAEIAAQMNALVVGGSADEALVTSDINSVSNAATAADDGFESVLRDSGGKPADKPAPQGLETARNVNQAPAQQQGSSASPALSFFQGGDFSVESSLLSPSSFSADDAQNFGLTLSGQVSANSPAAIITQAHSAAQSHPATQMVAATLQRAGANGQDANITLRLDPPELGRVDVRLRFGQDKNLKTVIRVENEDTLQLLQRDSQTLERALQNAGLDTDGGISFELAQDGDFGGDNERGGGHDSGGAGAGDAAGEEILETTMTWHVDPETGHMRYDLLV